MYYYTFVAFYIRYDVSSSSVALPGAVCVVHLCAVFLPADDAIVSYIRLVFSRENQNIFEPIVTDFAHLSVCGGKANFTRSDDLSS